MLSTRSLKKRTVKITIKCDRDHKDLGQELQNYLSKVLPMLDWEDKFNKFNDEKLVNFELALDKASGEFNLIFNLKLKPKTSEESRKYFWTD
mgnify:CR=1 FL=1